MNGLLKWMGTDGLLHFLVCYAMMLTFYPFIGWYSLIPTFVASVGKEHWDYFHECDNNSEQVGHDLICDAAGTFVAMVVIIIVTLINL